MARQLLLRRPGRLIRPAQPSACGRRWRRRAPGRAGPARCCSKGCWLLVRWTSRTSVANQPSLRITRTDNLDGRDGKCPRFSWSNNRTLLIQPEDRQIAIVARHKDEIAIGLIAIDDRDGR